MTPNTSQKKFLAKPEVYERMLSHVRNTNEGKIKGKISEFINEAIEFYLDNAAGADTITTSPPQNQKVKLSIPKFLELFDNSGVYKNIRMTKKELEKVIFEITGKKGRRTWEKYGKFLRETGRIELENGTEFYWIVHDKFEHITEENKAILGKKRDLKSSDGFRNTFKIGDLADTIYKKLTVGQKVNLSTIQRIGKIKEEKKAREVIKLLKNQNKLDYKIHGQWLVTNPDMERILKAKRVV